MGPGPDPAFPQEEGVVLLSLPSVDALSIQSPMTMDRRAALLQGPRWELSFRSRSGGSWGRVSHLIPPSVAPFPLTQIFCGIDEVHRAYGKSLQEDTDLSLQQLQGLSPRPSPHSLHPPVSFPHCVSVWPR